MGLAVYLGCYAAGIWGASLLPPGHWWLPLLPLLPATALLVLRNHRSAAVLATAFFLTLGVSAFHLFAAPPESPDQVSSLPQRTPLLIRGEVLSRQDRTDGSTRLDLEVAGAALNRFSIPAQGKLRLSIGEGETAALPGDVIQVRCRLKTPRPFGTPGEFDYPRHLAARGIFATAFVKQADALAVLPQARSGGVSGLFGGLRQRLSAFIDARVPPRPAQLLKALVLGDKGALSAQDRSLLAAAGLSHLFAVSGLHLGLIALLLYRFALTAYRRSEPLLLWAPPRRTLPILLLLPLALFLLLTGSATPTCRAYLMAAATAALLLCGRHTRPLHLLCATAFVLLLANPLELFEPAFQLSFAGVLGIMVLLPRWLPGLAPWPPACRWPAALFLTTAAATIATTPVVLHHFHLLAPAGLITNLVAVPTIGFGALPLGLAGAALSSIWPEAAALLLKGASAILQANLDLAELLTGLPPLSGRPFYGTLTQSASLGLLALALLLPPRRRFGLRYKGLLCAAAILGVTLPGAAPRPLELTALSVGQGEAMLLRLAGRGAILVDGGGLYGDSFDVGERLLAPALGRLGVDRLEAVMLTHDHPDHRKGLLYILKRFAIASFWSPAPLPQLHPSLQEVLVQKGIPVVTFAPGWTHLPPEHGTQLAVHAPDDRLHGENDRSLALYAASGDDSVLLTGDLEKAGVLQLAQEPWPARVSVLKLPHHGSRHSAPQRLLERFSPRFAVVSAGAANRHGLPAPEVTLELARRGIPLLRTDRDGTVRLTCDDGRWRTEYWANGLFR